MFIRIWINILILLAALYGAYCFITYKPYMADSWQYYFYSVSPWVLLFGSIKAWHRCYIWRRMTAGKHIAPELSRGRHRPLKQKQHPGILEYASMVLFLTAITAILKQLGIPNASWMICTITGSYFMLRLAIRMIG